MKFIVDLNLEIQADSKKEVKDRIEEFMRYVMRVERNDLGLMDWSYDVKSPNEISGCGDNNPI